jgi:hypothetical protein
MWLETNKPTILGGLWWVGSFNPSHWKNCLGIKSKGDPIKIKGMLDCHPNRVEILSPLSLDNPISP